MVNESDTSDRDETTDVSEHAPNSWLNGLLGAAVTIFLSFIPFSPVLGGGLAGYLEGGDTRDGGRVGALSGVFAVIPLALIIVFVAVFGLLMTGEPVFILFASVGIVVIGFYLIALSAVGGVLGVYIKNDILAADDTRR